MLQGVVGLGIERTGFYSVTRFYRYEVYSIVDFMVLHCFIDKGI